MSINLTGIQHSAYYKVFALERGPSNPVLVSILTLRPTDGHSDRLGIEYSENYANVAKIALEAISSYAADVRAARQIKGAAPAKLP